MSFRTRQSFRSSRPDNWTLPRQPMSASERLMRHGPIQPMEQARGFLARLFGLGA